MRAAAAPLLFALVGALASGSALAFKGGGVKGGGGGGGGFKSSGGFNGHSGHSGGFKSSGGLNKSRGHVQHHGGHHHHHHGHHHHNGVAFVGVGFASPWPWYYPPAYYPYYQPVVYETQATTYVEQGGTQQSGTPAAEPSGWWYYCDASRAYYPYVKECASAWQRVPALPPPPQ